MDVLSQTSLLTTTCAAFATGVAFHLSIISVEVDYRVWRLLGAYLTLLFVLAVSYAMTGRIGFLEIITRVLLISSSFNTGLLLSIGLYRLAFHRLRNFPGPTGAKVSRFYASFLASKNIQYNLEVKKLHDKYGDFVRTGPRELTIFRASAVTSVYGPQTTCRKSAWYSQASDDVTKCSLNASRDFEDHKRRRQAWDQGFSVKALNSYEPRIKILLDQFISQMKAKAGTPIDATAWSMFFTFDVMGAIGLGKDFEMLTKGVEHSAIKGLHDQMKALGVLSPIPWFLSMAAAVPGLAGSFVLFTNWCGEQVVEREKNFDPTEYPPDIFSWLLKAKKEKSSSAPPGREALIEDSQLIIIGGSESTASTVANALYFLCKHPEIHQKLQKALEEAFRKEDLEWDFERVKAIPYLEAVINETMRLKPAVPSGFPRVTPAAGIQIDEVFIPGDINVVTPTYLLQRDPRYFSEPDEFIPERWLEEGDAMIKDDSAFAPFSIGVYGCIGKNLALMQLRGIISLVAMSFNLEFAPGETGLEFDTKALDTLTLTLPPLMMVLRQRENDAMAR